MGMDAGLINMEFESDHYMVLVGHTTSRRHLFSKKNRHRVLVLDRSGSARLDVRDGVLIHGGKLAIMEELDAYLESMRACSTFRASRRPRTYWVRSRTSWTTTQRLQ